jgi:hypothetical protein
MRSLMFNRSKVAHGGADYSTFRVLFVLPPMGSMYWPAFFSASYRWYMSGATVAAQNELQDTAGPEAISN